MKGRVSSWNDAKGFGFIAVDNQSEKIFFHISSVKKATRKPSVGDAVVFDASKDSQGRLKATHVLLEGIELAKPKMPKRIITEPIRKDLLDYVLYFVIFILIAVSLSLFFKTGRIESSIVPGVLFLVAVFYIANRQKRPKNPLFSCANCRSVAKHDERSIGAWNRGFTRLYCKPCHQKWLREQPKEQIERSSYSSGKSGCLGLFVVMAFLPIALVVATIQWLA